MKIEHYGFLTTDIKKSINQFEQLGYKISSELIFDDFRGVNILFMNNENHKIELVESMRQDSVVSNIINNKKNMVYHTCYICENIISKIHELSNQGYFLISEAAPAIAFKGRLVAFMMSKYAGIIELLEEKEC